jgi:cell division protein ZapE
LSRNLGSTASARRRHSQAHAFATSLEPVLVMAKGPLARLEARIAAGEMDADPAQIETAAQLDALAAALQAWRPSRGWKLAGLFGPKGEPPRGLYIHGQVGRGKTMLMDLFFESVAFEPKRRIHFHEFMAEIHDRIALARKTIDGDPIPQVAAQIAAGCGLLCFDELHVTDIADAMILGRLFTGLFEKQVVMVATSNSHPHDLYRNGLNRELFLPFIDLIERHMDVLELAAAKDFRLDKLSGRQLYFTPLDETSRRALRAAFTRLTGVGRGRPMDLNVKGRILRVPEAARGVAHFTFADLCEAPLGTLDFLHVAHAFHTVIIEGIPCLLPQMRSATRRFVNLIDTLYDAHVGLVASAEAEPDQLYSGNDVLFERTVSRLTEMRSDAYLARRNTRVQAAPAT